MGTLDDEHVLLFEASDPNVGTDDLQLRGFHGEDRISELFRYELTLDCPLDGGIGPEVARAMLGRQAAIAFGPLGVVRVAGVLSDIVVFPGNNNGKTSYQATLRPRFWLTTLTTKSRIFNDTSIPDIVTQILTQDYGWRDGTDFEMRLNETYTAREEEYVVQYQETDFDFISRWLEHFGIFYCFEQTDDGDKLVFLDSNASTVSVPGFEEMGYYFGGEETGPGQVADVEQSYSARTARVHLRDFDWRTPNTVTADHDIDTENGFGVYNEYGAHFRDGDGSLIARVRAEERLAHSERLTGRAVTPEMAAGCHFTVQNAPLAELDAKLLLTAVRHFAERQGDGQGSTVDYRNEWEAIFHATPYRPARLTPRPRVYGLVNGVVDGTTGGSTAAPVDDKGRYKVIFPFDMHPGEAGRRTRWIRMAQASSGGEYGTHFPLHLGTEVVIAHIDGDPDRPIIVGAVPNAANPHYIHNARATRSAIKTRSGIIIDFEDDA
jgi:type VI secretion system secreted protein VgrG